MKLGASGKTILVLLCSLALPAWSQQYYLYEPKPTVPDAKEQAKDAVLVKEVPVLEGDTLYGISRKFSGHGTYYSQILLFNDIKNPNLIYTGDTLKIPLPRGNRQGVPVSTVRPRSKVLKKSIVKGKSAVRAVQTPEKRVPAAVVNKTSDNSAERPLSEVKKTDSGNESRITKNMKNVDKVPGKTAADQMPVADQAKVTPTPYKNDLTTPTPGSVAGQQLFEKAVRAYRQDDCRTALELFDRYLADNAASPLAADASLYKAECYLKLSAQ